MRIGYRSTERNGLKHLSNGEEAHLRSQGRFDFPGLREPPKRVNDVIIDSVAPARQPNVREVRLCGSGDDGHENEEDDREDGP
jgi:hypothetical protein